MVQGMFRRFKLWWVGLVLLSLVGVMGCGAEVVPNVAVETGSQDDPETMAAQPPAKLPE